MEHRDDAIGLNIPATQTLKNYNNIKYTMMPVPTPCNEAAKHVDHHKVMKETLHAKA